MQHFVELAARHLPALAHFDALTPALVSTAAEVPFYAATLARARLGRAQQRLAAALKDPGYVEMFAAGTHHVDKAVRSRASQWAALSSAHVSTGSTS